MRKLSRKDKVFLTIVFLLLLAGLKYKLNVARRDAFVDNPQETISVNQEEIYIFDEDVPEDYIKLINDFGNDHRSLSVFLFNKDLEYIDNKNVDLLVIRNENYPDLYDYKFYSDVESLVGLVKGEVYLYGGSGSHTLVTRNKDNEKNFEYFESEMDRRLLRKYLFTYGEMDYLISVEMASDKKDQYIELTNKMLSTLIPHTVSVNTLNKIMGKP